MERRAATRIPFTVKSFICHDETRHEGTVLDVSLEGLYIKVPYEFPLHMKVTVELQLETGGFRKKLAVKGTVVRHESEGSAVKFIRMDIDSYSELRDILMNKSDDPMMIMDEFYCFIEKNQIT